MLAASTSYNTGLKNPFPSYLRHHHDHVDMRVRCRVTPMVWSLVGDALNRYVQALCMCIIFTFVDDFFGAGSLQLSTNAQKHEHNAIRGRNVRLRRFVREKELLCANHRNIRISCRLPHWSGPTKRSAIEKCSLFSLE